MTGPRRPRRAVLDWEQRGFIRWAYIEHYTEHEPFTTALLALYDSNCASREHRLAGLQEIWDVDALTWEFWPHGEAEWARAYLKAIVELAQTFGLERLVGCERARLGRPKDHGARFDPVEGEALIHGWCNYRARRVLEMGHSTPPDWLALFPGSGGMIPQVGAVFSRDEYPQHLEDGRQWVVVDERRRPRGQIHLEFEWNPTLWPSDVARSETKAQVKARLLANAREQIESELERIAALHEEAGYRFPDTSPKAREHIRLLFEHVALQKSYGEIAATHHDGWQYAPTVYNSIKPYADKIGIYLSDARRAGSTV